VSGRQTAFVPIIADRAGSKGLERVPLIIRSIRAGAAHALTLLFIFALSPAAARAQPIDASRCPAGNLLAGKQPVTTQAVRGRPALATDEERAPEGAQWNAPLALVLDSDKSALTWDLGALVPVQAAWIQADNNDSYTLLGSDDGQSFRTLGRIEPQPGDGLRGRVLRLDGKPVRFLRFGEGVGDGFYSLAEIAVYCEIPTPFPPALRVGHAPMAPGARADQRFWNDETSARWELILALAALLLLRWGHKLDRAAAANATPVRTHGRLRARLLALLGGLAALTYVNFGAFHFGNFLHQHEWTHYYLGSKYFAELSYDRLYECLSTADVEAGLRRRVELRPITNLRTNILEKTDDVLAHPERCTQHFTPARWQAFKRDVAFFRNRMSARGWDDVQLDHGYNATPLWNTIGGFLASLSAANPVQLHLLALLDPLSLLATLAVVWWAFGWRVLAIALLVFATNFPSRFYWTGGSFLRWDWLFFLVAGICCLRKSRPVLAGAALALAAGLRIFPIFALLGPALALGWQLWRGHRSARSATPACEIDKRIHLRLFASAAVTGCLSFAISLAGSGGLSAYQRFAVNTAKHQATPLVNHMGLRTVVAWRPSEVGRLMKDDRQTDPWLPWKSARLRAWHEALPLYFVLATGFLVLIGLAARAEPPWVMAALGTAFIPIGVELTSYYMMFILAVALLTARRAELGCWLLGLTAFTQFVAWAPLRNMSVWMDEQHTLMSAATVIVFAAIAWRLRRVDPHG
jgi:hypothetical protein